VGVTHTSASYLKKNRHSTGIDTSGMEASLVGVYIFHVDTVIIFLHVTNTMMMSRREHKLDRLKGESKGVANKVPTCAVPMHASQVVGKINVL